MPDEIPKPGLHDGVVRAGEALFCGDDQPYFPGQLVELRFGRQLYAIVPRFRRVVAEWIAITVEATSDHLSFQRDGDDLIVIDDDALNDDDPTSTSAVERIRPDADGRYIFKTWDWNEPDVAAECLDETARTALALLAGDNPRPVAPLIRYVIENAHPTPDPQALRRIRAQHRTLTRSPTARADATESEETHDE
ncbi:hypothetical protein [Amycolatopsis sp. DG1A-15b]|uniref:hypothetical protein n=1 Tax=Amycolatopsis sp. DG1A-15b TaxID=3052846 RepID=UPI00255BA51A|nr:hypothetical protein [Amycolatopsis sp. DG1A-15b]WIX85778.1 hypothetical protein QRY02_31810 [Amycolatopsis sp. DG1A-15b]